MKTELSTAYSRTLEDRIADAERAISSINPGSVMFIAPLYLVKNTKARIGEYPFDDLSNVNGFDVLKINSMIRHIKTDKRKIIAASGTAVVDRVNWKFEVNVPANFSGRDAFVSYYYQFYSLDVDKAAYFKQWVTNNENSILFEGNSLFNPSNDYPYPRLHYFILFSRSK